MRGILAATIAIMLVGDAAAETTGWWGQVSVRQRQETYREYIDVIAGDDPELWGKLRYKDENSRTRVGYQIGYIGKITDNLFAGFTLRSGLFDGGQGAVMWQDINNISGLEPKVQEAFLDWRTPYLRILAGKVPQKGNALLDLYAAPLWLDRRGDDPRDGIFDDRIAAVNGMKLLAPVGPATFRGIYHADAVSGCLRTLPEGAAGKEQTRFGSLDKQVYLLGGELKLVELLNLSMPDQFEGLSLVLNADYGWPYRWADRYKTGKDSIYAKEELWGGSMKAGYTFPQIDLGNPNLELEYGYAYNWLDSVYTSHFRDYILRGEFFGVRLTYRYQYGTQDHQFEPYKGDRAVRSAAHYYINYTFRNLDIQPRVIWFDTVVEKRIGDEVHKIRVRSNKRMEITTTVRF